MDLSDNFNRKVDGTTARLVESYRMLLRKGVIEDSVEPQTELQMNTAAANIAYYSQSLLDQINELRMEILLKSSSAQSQSVEGDEDNEDEMKVGPDSKSK